MPNCNFSSIREGIVGIEEVMANELVELEPRRSSKILLIHPAIKHRVSPLRPRTH